MHTKDTIAIRASYDLAISLFDMNLLEHISFLRLLMLGLCIY